MSNPSDALPEGAFEVHLAKRNQTLTVPPGVSILKVLQDAGLDVPFSCSEGVCGTCLTPGGLILLVLVA